MDFEDALAIIIVLTNERAQPYYYHTEAKNSLFDDAWSRIQERVDDLVRVRETNIEMGKYNEFSNR